MQKKAWGAYGSNCLCILLNNLLPEILEVTSERQESKNMDQGPIWGQFYL